MRHLPNPFPDPIVERVTQAIRSVRYGAVHIIVHDRQVVQIETTEKIRLDKDGPNPKVFSEQSRTADRTSGGATENPPVPTGSPEAGHPRKGA